MFVLYLVDVVFLSNHGKLSSEEKMMEDPNCHYSSLNDHFECNKVIFLY